MTQTYEGYETIRLDKSLYKGEGGLSGQLERMDPSHRYENTGLAGLDAFERQLKRFDIKVSGAKSDPIEKFFATGDSAALFPEYVTRAVAQGAREGNVLEELIASRTDISALDYRSITSDLDSNDLSDTIAEGAAIPPIKITLNEQLVRLKKRGRLLQASYEAIRFQRADVFSVALKQIGGYIVRAQLKDAVEILVDGDGMVPGAQTITTSAAGQVAYGDLLQLWGLFEEFEMNVLLGAPDMVQAVLAVEELRDPATGLHFQSTGSLATPLGAKLIKSSAVPAGKLVALDRRYALEMVCAGGIQVEHDKLIDCQLERAAVTAICGFNKLFPSAVKVLELQ